MTGSKGLSTAVKSGLIGWTLPGRALFWMCYSRYLRFWPISMGGAIINTLLFLMIFDLAIDWGSGPAEDLPAFIGPGMVAFAVLLGSFEQAGADLMIVKLEGGISSELTAPIASWEWVGVRMSAGVCSGLTSGSAALLTVCFFLGRVPDDIVGLYGMLVTLALPAAALGVLVGLHAQRWDFYSGFETFLIIPIVYLSGLFFPIEALPVSVREFMVFNPLFSMFEGIRGAVNGWESGLGWVSVAALLLLALAFGAAACLYALKSPRIRP